MTRARTSLLLIAACLLGMLALAPAASAGKIWKVKGAGFGHGVGMSQYGAYGFAKRGTGYREILTHYYRGTTVSETSSRTVRVLLRKGASKVGFRGASSACGRSLTPSKRYRVKRRGRKVILRAGKRRIANCGRVLRATGGVIKVSGKGRYRGAIEIRPGLSVINAVGLEDYVRGVISKESPSSWPLEALKAQAVAARSYALATAKGKRFDHYDDTRSQVYAGVGAETARTNTATADTALEVVKYRGRVAETYFFSTSGGHTENVENSFGGGSRPYLKGVPDPYDTGPYHRWKRKFSASAIGGRIGVGRLRRVKVLRRGVSPRIVKARFYGSAGKRTLSGTDIRGRLNLPDSWAYFKRGKKRR